MPVNIPDTAAIVAALYLYDGSAWDPAVAVAAAATQDETAVQYLRVAAALYGWDGVADLRRVLVDTDGNLQVDVLTGGGAWMADDSAFTFGTSNVSPMGAVFDDAASDSVDENDIGVPRMTSTRVLLAAIADPTTPTRRAAVNTPDSDLYGTADNTLMTLARGMLFNGGAAWERVRTIGAVGADAAATGITAAALVGMFDNTAPTSTTENQYGALRMSAQRVLYTTAPAVSVDVNTGVGADVDAAVAAATGLRLLGFSARETAGATAQFHIVNGATGAAGTKIVRVNLAANESRDGWYWPGLDAASGISIDWVSGSIDVDIWYLTLP